MRSSLKIILTVMIFFCIFLLNVGPTFAKSKINDTNHLISDEEIIEDVSILINLGLWNEAINEWNLLSPAGQNIGSLA